MVFRQITHDDLGCASYLVGDPAAGVAAVVDPKLEVDEYLALAERLGVRIAHILETHNHADHVSGHGPLAAATGAAIHIHATAAPGYAHEPFEDGWQLELGSVLVRAVHTPGHRPEHTVFALVERARGDEPWAVLTGDTLLVGDIARPDLAVEREAGARDMFRSLHERLLSLPDTCEVWPGHLGGSLCGGPGLDRKICSTVGYERAHNRLLAERDEAAFVAAATATLPPQPPNLHAIVALNRGPLGGRPPQPEPLAPHAAAAAAAAGALVVDVRTDREFAAGHVPGAVCVPAVRTGFATKLAWVAGEAEQLVFVGRDDADAARAARLAAAVALDAGAAVLAGGMTGWHAERRPTASLRRIDVDGLRAELADVQVIDVREADEWAAGHVPGALNVPYRLLHELPPGVDPQRPAAAVCATGQRAAVGASLLARLGVVDAVHVADGGVDGWRERGWPVERSTADGRRPAR